MRIKSKENRRPTTPKQLYIGSHPDPNRRLFVLLLMLGYSRGEAYQIAFKSKAKAMSANVQGCMCLKEENTQRIAKKLVEAWQNKEWQLNCDILRMDVINV